MDLQVKLKELQSTHQVLIKRLEESRAEIKKTEQSMKALEKLIAKANEVFNGLPK